MLWYKNWLELRARFLVLVVLIALPYAFIAPRVTGGQPGDRLARISSTMHATAHYFGWPAFAVLFAGAGIAALGAPGARNRVHQIGRAHV